jgi:hypothetical protein
MMSMLVVVREILLQHQPQMPFIVDQQLVGAFAS